MSTPVEQLVLFRQLFGKSSAFSHNSWEYALRLINVHILEMEDVLFHHNSAVMMPENPEGKSSADGTEDDATDPDDATIAAGQAEVTGVKALALVFRQLQFDERKRILIAAHTDTSGGTAYNFGLADLRAQNVLYLLTGNRDGWAAVCYEKQKVEDYQQILTYVFMTRRWPCNPGGIDNSWGSNTEHASENFITFYNSEYAKKKGAGQLGNPPALMRAIKNDGAKRWPEELWRAVFDLYSEDIAKGLSMNRAQFETTRQRMTDPAAGRFLYDTKMYVACGESFPIDDAEKSNYRSQSNRRVEVLFFDREEALAKDDFICPAEINRVHTKEECPLWNGWHFLPLYIDPNDLNGVAYHLRFRYYDRVLKGAAEVPFQLPIRAYVGTTEIPTRIAFGDGLYTVVVQFSTNAQATADANKVRFAFQTQNKWIYTANDTATPTVVEKTPTQIAALTFLNRWLYYDLPEEWNSDNWRCLVGTDIKDFTEQMKTRTAAGAPIIFNLDDIILVRPDGSQTITDRTGTADGKDATGKFPALSATDNPTANPPQFASRVRIIFVDPADNWLKIHYPVNAGTDEDVHNSSLIRFQTNAAGVAVNCIKDPPGGARVVVFCGEFYDVTSARTKQADAGFDPTKGHILGARAAILNDPASHYRKEVLQTDQTPMLHNPIIGDFDVHFLHGGGCDGTNTYSYLAVQWWAYVAKDTKPSNGAAGTDQEAPTDVDVTKCITTGMKNCNEHWNKKQYEFRDNAGVATQIIRPFFFFEANEAFKFTPPVAPNPVLDFGDTVQSAAMFASAEFTTARQTARGGKPRSIIFVVEETKGSWMRSYRAANNPFTIMRLRKKTLEDDAGRFPGANLPSGSGFPFAEFSDPGQYGCLAMAHEIGHATGQVDDYCEDHRFSGRAWDIPSFGQFGMLAGGNWMKDGNGNHVNTNFHQRTQSSEAYALRHDDKTMMDKNGPIRMRHAWRFACWLNQGGASAGAPEKPLDEYLDNVKFKVHYPHPSPVLEYYRAGAVQVSPWTQKTNARIQVVVGPPERTMHAFLYQILDETRRTKRATGAGAGNDIDFKAILVVRPLLSVCFQDVGAAVWSNADRNDWLIELNRWFLRSKNVLYDKFMLSGGGGDLDPTLIHFLPGIDMYPPAGAPTHNHFNYRVVVRRDNAAFSRAGDTLTLGQTNALIRELFYYLFNKAAASAGFTTADFAWLRTWFSGAGVANGAFSVVEI